MTPFPLPPQIPPPPHPQRTFRYNSAPDGVKKTTQGTMKANLRHSSLMRGVQIIGRTAVRGSDVSLEEFKKKGLKVIHETPRTSRQYLIPRVQVRCAQFGSHYAERLQFLGQLVYFFPVRVRGFTAAAIRRLGSNFSHRPVFFFLYAPLVFFFKSVP